MSSVGPTDRETSAFPSSPLRGVLHRTVCNQEAIFRHGRDAVTGVSFIVAAFLGEPPYCSFWSIFGRDAAEIETKIALACWIPEISRREKGKKKKKSYDSF